MHFYFATELFWEYDQTLNKVLRCISIVKNNTLEVENKDGGKRMNLFKAKNKNTGTKRTLKITQNVNAIILGSWLSTLNKLHNCSNTSHPEFVNFFSLNSF